MKFRIAALFGVFGLLSACLLGASIPSPDGTVWGCFSNDDGHLIVIDHEAGDVCPENFSPLNWQGSVPEPPTTSTSTTVPPSTTTSTVPPTTEPPTTSTTQPPSGGAPVVGQQFPTAATTGVPTGWSPLHTVNGDLVITQANTTWRDYLVHGSIEVRAANVTIDRSLVEGRIWNQWPGATQLTQFHMTVTNSTVDADVTESEHGSVGPGNYELSGSELHGSDGPRVSEAQALQGGTGAVSIVGNYFRAVVVPDCGFHIDGVQGYFGGLPVLIQGNTLDALDRNCVTGVVFMADHSKGADVIGNLLAAPNVPLRPQEDDGDPPRQWKIRGNAIVSPGNPETHPGVDCSLPSTDWPAGSNRRVTVDADYKVTSVGVAVNC